MVHTGRSGFGLGRRLPALFAGRPPFSSCVLLQQPLHLPLGRQSALLLNLSLCSRVQEREGKNPQPGM